MLDQRACCWLMSILTIVDLPLLPDVSAAMMSLLRSLCMWRAKVDGPYDPSLPGITVLVTILGVYFKQLPPREWEDWVEDGEEGWGEEEEDGEEEEKEEGGEREGAVP